VGKNARRLRKRSWWETANNHEGWSKLQKEAETLRIVALMMMM
jgi:hypothetical protein